MGKKKLQTFLSVTAVVLAATVGGVSASAQSVIFPQMQQAGDASLTQEENTYLLSNDLLSASFAKDDEGHLYFAGSSELGLASGANLFVITLGDGTELNSSTMTPSDVRIVELTAEPTAYRASLKYPGYALEADYSYENLDITWRAVLRNGSHYMRTEMDLAANGTDVEMKSVVPMAYSVDAAAYSAPAVVGNTRGAILASDHIFAGLETPMGINAIVNDNTVGENFTYSGWTPDMWEWSPADSEIPSEITSLSEASSGVKGARGYVSLRESGDYEFEFLYSSGNCRLNMLGVDVVNPETGEVVASDYHFGYTGNAKSNNVYTLSDIEAGMYMLRYFVATSEDLNSSGVINVDKGISSIQVVYDLDPETTTSTALTSAKTAVKAASTDDAVEYDRGTSYTFTWTPLTNDMWVTPDTEDIPNRIIELGVTAANVRYTDFDVNFLEAEGTFTANFQYTSGNHRLNMAGVSILDESGSEVAYDFHIGYSGSAKVDNVYTITVPYSGTHTMRVWIYIVDGETNTNGNIITNYDKVDVLHLPAASSVDIQGTWSRNTTLEVGEPWEISAVVGLIAPGQARRSVLSYVERERAVAWRPMPIYNSWYELNINRNNAADYNGNMTIGQCVDVVNQWKTNFYDVYGTQLEAYVWDDGWDEYGTWDFNCNFPNGFDEVAEITDAMETGIGAWLGPVGGYGTSGTYRRAYWTDNGGMQLSNPAYYEVFLNAISSLVEKYDFRFFKFDGISSQFSSVGPDSGTTGEENAEGIIRAERAVRKMRPDIFFNTTVGTWASPFWFGISDCVWRQENDCGTIGNNSINRENWITYRDRLVYQNFVTNSPLCPINSIMTHGFLFSKFGDPGNYSRDYDAVVREMRCAFACGTNMVEVYADYSLMNEVANADGETGMLWGELDKCIRWQREMADVLPDIHWVGGSPWTGATTEVYGWASWNAQKATLTLRNGGNDSRTFTTTLRDALDIPEGWNTSITISPAFADQAELSGMPVGEAINIDTELTLTLPGSTVFVFNGVDNNPISFGTSDIECIEAAEITVPTASEGIYDLMGRRLATPVKGAINIINGKKTLVK